MPPRSAAGNIPQREGPKVGFATCELPIWHIWHALWHTKFTLAAMRFEWKPVPWLGAICARADMIDLDKMIDPGQDSDLCGRSLEFAPSSALLRRASTYLAVAPDLPLWLPMPAKDVEPLVCLGLSAHPTVPCPTAQQKFLDPGQHVGQSYQSLRNEAWTCLGENEMAHLISYKQRVEQNHNSHFMSFLLGKSVLEFFGHLGAAVHIFQAFSGTTTA